MTNTMNVSQTRYDDFGTAAYVGRIGCADGGECVVVIFSRPIES